MAEKFVGKVDKLTKHNFIAKHQSLYLAKLKSNIQQNGAVITFDFSEN